MLHSLRKGSRHRQVNWVLSADRRDPQLQPTAPLRLRLTITVAFVVLAALVAAGVARLDDRGELTTGLLSVSPAAPANPAPSNLATDLGDLPLSPARVAVVPDKAAAQAQEWEAAGVAALQLAQAEAARQAAATTVPPAAAAAAPAPAAPAPPRSSSRPPAPPPTQPPSGGGSLNAKLDNIARCESGMNPKAYNPAGPYFGAFQFHISTWRGLGEAGNPTNRSYSYQRDVAARLQRSSGWGAWPHCSAQYGYL